MQIRDLPNCPFYQVIYLRGYPSIRTAGKSSGCTDLSHGKSLQVSSSTMVTVSAPMANALVFNDAAPLIGLNLEFHRSFQSGVRQVLREQ